MKLPFILLLVLKILVSYNYRRYAYYQLLKILSALARVSYYLYLHKSLEASSILLFVLLFYNTTYCLSMIYGTYSI